MLKAVDTWQGLLRASIASAGNDHRLGANEAPPAIISIFLGEVLTDLFSQIEKGKVTVSKKGGVLDTGVNFLPKLPRDPGDRNRTSPFAFTGNKFEFRAVSSGQSIAMPNICLNVAVTDALDSIASDLEKAVASGKKVEEAAWALLPKVVKQHKRIIFNGNNYSDEWQKDAKKRGLLNLRNTVDALPELVGRARHQGLREAEGPERPRAARARGDRLRDLQQDGQHRSAAHGAHRQPLHPAGGARVPEGSRPGRRRGQGRGRAVEGRQGAGEDAGQADRRAEGHVDAAGQGARAQRRSSASKHAKYFRDKVIPLMEKLRNAGDALELNIPHEMCRSRMIPNVFIE